MSLILCLESSDGREVSIQVQPDDDFQTFLSKAKVCVGKDVDITTIIGNEKVSPTENMYQFMLKAALSDDVNNPSSIDHEIVDVSDQITDIRRNKKIINKNNNMTECDTNKCCFCGNSVNPRSYVSYIFDEKDQKEMKESKHRRNKGLAKVVCGDCLQNDFVNIEETPKIFDEDMFLVIRNNVQYFYKKKMTDIVDCTLDLIDKNDGANDCMIVESETHCKYFSCRLCKAVFDALPVSHCLEHVSSRAEGLVFPCVLCEYGYTSFDDLKNHMNSSHKETNNTSSSSNSAPKTPTVSLCKGKTEKGLKLLKEILNRQEQNSAQEEYCLDEDTGILRKRSMDEITESDHANTKTDSVLIKDSESDTESGVWIIQAADEDCDDSSQISQGCDNDYDAEDCDTAVLYQCDTCSKEFYTVEKFASHNCVTKLNDAGSIVLVERDSSDYHVEDETIARVIAVKSNNETGKELEYTERKDVEGPHKCKMCKKSFHTKIRLQFHIRYIHNAGSDPSTLRCSICPDLAFSSEGMLYDHIHFTHPKSKKYECPVEGCNRKFFIKGVLRNHLSCHSGQRTHPCTYESCDKLFFDKQTLNEHKVTHLKVKPFQCHICHKFLNRKSRLRMHLLNHESQPSSSPVLACKRCNAAFPNTSAAENHLDVLGNCTSKVDLETLNSTNEEMVDDQGIVTPCNDSGIELNSVIDQESDQSVEGCGLFEDISERRYFSDDEESQESENGSKQELKPNSSHDSVGGKWKSMLDELNDDAKKTITIVEVDVVYRCEYCEKVYCKHEALNLHREEHQGQENPYTCHICGAQFSTYSRCTTHKTTHGFYRIASSKSKDRSTKSSLITKDDSFPVIKHFLCEVCNKSYLHWTYLQVHRKLKHSEDVHMYKCLTCGDEFPNSWGVAYHRKKIHGQSTGSAPPNETPAKNVERVQYSCPECGIVLSTKAQLFLHKRSAHPTPLSPLKPDVFCCSKCNKRYNTKSGLQGHYKRQHVISNSSGINKCSECEKIFANPSGLNTHVRRVHMKEIKYQCKVCGLGFYSSCDLRTHVRRHSGEKPFPCHLCGKHFRTKGMRDQHVRIHSGERPYKCDLCGVGFRRSYALRNHRLIHIPQTRSLHCPICPRVFRLKADFNTHMRHTHCVDPLTYTPDNVVNVEESNVENHTISESQFDIIDNSKIEDDGDKQHVLILNTDDQTDNVGNTCFFTTIFEDDQNAFIDTIEEVQMPESVFDESNQELTSEQIINANAITTDGGIIQTTGELILQGENSSNNLCIISGESSTNGEIILDANMLTNTEYVLDETDEVIADLSEDSRSIIFKDNAGPSKILEVNTYLTRLVALNSDTDINEIKFINIENDLVSDKIELSTDHLNDLYGSNVVIDKVTSIDDDDVVDKETAFVIDWQETEEGNEKSLDESCKYFTEA